MTILSAARLPARPGNPAPGDWDTIEFDSGSSSTISNAIVRYGGGFSPYADLYQNGGTLAISHTTIASSSNTGFSFNAGTASISSSTIRNNQNAYGIDAEDTGSLTITSSTFSTNDDADGNIIYTNGLFFSSSGNTDTATTTGTGYRGFLISGTLSTSTATWGKDLPFIVDAFNVGSGTILTVNHGAIIKSDAGANIAVLGNGTLNMQGASSDPIYFTSLSDNTIGGDTMVSTSTPQPGDAGDIEIDAGASATITNTILRYGGATYGSLHQNGGNLSASHLIIASSSKDGFDISGGITNFSTSTVRNTGYDGIYEYGSNGILTLTSSTFSTNGNASDAGFADVYLDLGGGLTFSPSGNTDVATTTGTGYRGVILTGDVVTSTTLTRAGSNFPYVISGALTITSGTTLTIQPNTIVKFSLGSYIDVAANSTLSVNPNGYIENGLDYFTSITDDFGGDTDGAGTSTPQPGDGGYIEIDSGATSTIDYADFLYSGTYPAYSSIYQNGGSLTLLNSSIASSSNYGVYSTGGKSVVSSSYFLNDPYGIWMNSGSVTVASSAFESTSSAYYGIDNNSGVTSTAVATNDYWNSFAGPYNTNSHPTGTVTEAVSDYVNYIPWIGNNGTMDHYLEGYSSVQSGTVKYYASTTYSTALNAAVGVWNALASSTSGGIHLASTTLASSTGYLKISDVNWSDVTWDGLYTHDNNLAIPSSTIQFNQYYANSFAAPNLQHMAMHELGHGLGLYDENVLGNVEFLYNTAQTTLGSQDVSDYDYLW